MLADDLGFSDLGCYGSEIPTPNLDLLAANGVRFSNFHVNPMCSPTRASLLTGLNSHMAGFGHVAHSDAGFPGYAMELRNDAVTLAEAFRASGWATFAVGKWHLCKDSDMSDAGSKHSWPLQVGFDRYYGILDGFTNFHQPHRLYRDNHVVEVDEYPGGYYFTDDLTDNAIDMVRRLRSSHPTKPFLMYFAHGAVHAPLHAKPADMARHRDRYHAGWDVIREKRLAQQKSLGVIPEHAVLPPRNSEPEHEVAAWQDLTDTEQQLFARYQEVYAAMVDNVDQNFGRLRDELVELGEWDNTIVVFTSDNGASREGQSSGTPAYFRTLLGAARNRSEDLVESDITKLDLIGGPQSMPHYPRGWAMASNTPFRLYKVNTHQGGQQVPLIVSWPAGHIDSGSIRSPYQHVTDVMATLADMAGVTIPDERNGRQGPERVGNSFAAALYDQNATSTHPEQYYEMWGHRGYYKNGWSAVTCHQQQTAFSDDRWELYDLTTDPTETNDVSDQHPEIVEDLVSAWETAAWANQVFPLDERSMLKEVTRPTTEDQLTEGITLTRQAPTLERYRSLKLVQYRSFNVVVSFAYSPGDEGVLFAHGDQGGGYSTHVESGRLWVVYNAYGDMTELDCGPVDASAGPGSREIEITVAVNALPKLRVRLDVVIGDVVVAESAELPMLMAMAPFQGIDVGIDRGSPVSWDRHQLHGTFPYTGQLHWARWEPGPDAPEAPKHFLDMLRELNRGFE